MLIMQEKVQILKISIQNEMMNTARIPTTKYFRNCLSLTLTNQIENNALYTRKLKTMPNPV
jgi:hypothetical protein